MRKEKQNETRRDENKRNEDRQNESKQNDNQKREKTAEEIMELVRRTLLVTFRYFDRAIYALPLRSHSKITGLGTDGRYLYYGISYVIECFLNRRAFLHRDFLHTLLHCVFRHFDISGSVDRRVWDLACDIAVENLIRELEIRDTQIPQETCQAEYLSVLKEKLHLLSAEKIYHLFRKDEFGKKLFEKIDSEKCRQAHFFSRDDHTFWYSGEEETDIDKGGAYTAKVFSDLGITDPGHVYALPKAEIAELWKQIADTMKVSLEAESLEKGAHAGAFSYQIREAARDKVDYAEFLRRFAVQKETISTNPEEFDYIWYMYGLNLYADMPLMEPLEYREMKKIREFVIVIDTSGSISKQTIRRFLESTFSILQSDGSFFSGSRICLIQCDAKVQHAVLLESAQEIRDYLNSFTVYGHGGTDFRPAFAYVDRLLTEKKLHAVQGLLYFTDGLGTYPKTPASYKTAFIFTGDHCESETGFPVWAMKVILTEEEIEEIII